MQKNQKNLEIKEIVLNRRANGESVKTISYDTGVPRSTIYYWDKENKISKEEKTASDPRTYYKQKEHIKKLEGIIELLNEAFDISTVPLSKKLKILETHYYENKLSVHAMCEALNVPRGTFYNYIFRGKKGNTKAANRRAILSKKIETAYYESNQIYGANKIRAVLKSQGESVSIEYVREIMRELNIQSIRIGAKKNSSKREQNL